MIEPETNLKCKEKHIKFQKMVIQIVEHIKKTYELLLFI